MDVETTDFNASFLCVSVTGFHNIIRCSARNSKCPTHVICDNVPYSKRDVKRVLLCKNRYLFITLHRKICFFCDFFL